jgi:hypothetical protein
MDSPLGEYKASKHNEKIKEWKKYYYLQQVKSTSVIPIVLPCSNKVGMGISLSGA